MKSYNLMSLNLSKFNNSLILNMLYLMLNVTCFKCMMVENILTNNQILYHIKYFDQSDIKYL